jgi:hypothetical protein
MGALFSHGDPEGSFGLGRAAILEMLHRRGEMHASASALGKLFFDTYGFTGTVLDIGSTDVNGSLRPFAWPEDMDRLRRIKDITTGRG